MEPENLRKLPKISDSHSVNATTSLLYHADNLWQAGGTVIVWMFPEISGIADISGMTILQKYTNRHSILA